MSDWGKAFIAALRRGCDHGYAAYVADRAEKESRRKSRKEAQNICRDSRLPDGKPKESMIDPKSFPLTQEEELSTLRAKLKRAQAVVEAARDVLSETDDREFSFSVVRSLDELQKSLRAHDEGGKV